jgi:hypothetical protein
MDEREALHEDSPHAPVHRRHAAPHDHLPVKVRLVLPRRGQRERERHAAEVRRAVDPPAPPCISAAPPSPKNRGTHSGRLIFCRFEKKSLLRIVDAERMIPARFATIARTSSGAASPSAATRSSGRSALRLPVMSSFSNVLMTGVAQRVHADEGADKRTRPVLHERLERLERLRSVGLDGLQVRLEEDELEVPAQVREPHVRVLAPLRVRRSLFCLEPRVLDRVAQVLDLARAVDGDVDGVLDRAALAHDAEQVCAASAGAGKEGGNGLLMIWYECRLTGTSSVRLSYGTAVLLRVSVGRRSRSSDCAAGICSRGFCSQSMIRSRMICGARQRPFPSSPGRERRTAVSVLRPRPS